MQDSDKDKLNFGRPSEIFMRHRVVEIFGVDSVVLDSESEIVKRLERIAGTLNLIIWKVFAYKFSLGVTAIAVISDSHVAIHTWPEYGYVHFDIITCSEKAKWGDLIATIESEFHPEHIKYHSDLGYS